MVLLSTGACSQDPPQTSHWHLSHSGHVVGRFIRRFNLKLRQCRFGQHLSSWNAAFPMISNDWPTNRANLKQTIKPNFKEETLKERHIASVRLHSYKTAVSQRRSERLRVPWVAEIWGRICQRSTRSDWSLWPQWPAQWTGFTTRKVVLYWGRVLLSFAREVLSGLIPEPLQKASTHVWSTLSVWSFEPLPSSAVLKCM